MTIAKVNPESILSNIFEKNKGFLMFLQGVFVYILKSFNRVMHGFNVK